MYMISSEIPIFTFIENKNVINVKFMIIKKKQFPPQQPRNPKRGFLWFYSFTHQVFRPIPLKKKKKKNPI